MRYDRLEKLYGSLMDITDRFKGTLGDADPEALVRLSEEHRNVMNALKASGLSRDPKLLPVVMESSRQVGEMVAELKKQLIETSSELKAAGNRKKMVCAYGRM